MLRKRAQIMGNRRISGGETARLLKKYQLSFSELLDWRKSGRPRD
jgi:hypothetical protein